MPFIDMGKEFANAKETPMAPEGQYDLICKEVEQNNEKGWIRVQIAFDGNEDYAPFGHFLSLPDKEKDAAKDQEKDREVGTTSKFKMLMIKRFLKAFSVPMDKNGFDPNDIPGSTARLGVSTSVNEKTQQRNQQLNLPQLPEEG